MKNSKRKTRAKPEEIFRLSAISKRSREFFFRIISFFLIFVFSWSQVLPADTAMAFQTMAAGVIKAPANERITFPDFARVEWANAAVQAPRGVVYLFQDAHTSLLAQQRITQTLLELRKQGAIDAVLVEGAAGRLTTERFDARPDVKKTPELIENLERQGYLHGAAAFYLLRPDTDVAGLETPGLYRENRQAFRDVFSFRYKIDSVTERFKVEWQRWLRGHMDEESRAFFLNSASRHTDSIDPAYFQQLLRMATDKAGISWSIGDQAEWPQLIRVQRMLEIQPRLRIDEARAAFKDLRKVLPASFKEKLGFIQMRIDGSLKETRVQEDASFYRDFAAQLLAEFMKRKQPVLPYRAFYDWLACETFRQEIRAEDLSLEIERLEDRIWKSWFPKPEDRSWMALGRLGVLLAKASRLELLRGEVHQFSRAMEAKAFEAWIGKFLPEEKETFVKFGNKALSFYKLAEEREQGFGARLSETLEELSLRKIRTPRVAVVTGGYHKSGLLENLKSQGLRVAVVTPVLEQVDQNIAYLDRMLETTPATSTLSMVPSAVVGRSELRELIGSENAQRSETRLSAILGEASLSGTSADTVRKVVPTEFRWKFWIRWLLTAAILLFSSRGLSQEAPNPYKADLAELNRIAGQGFNVNSTPAAVRPAVLLSSGRLNTQSFVWGKGLGGGGKNLEELARMNPEARRAAIQALLQNELRGRYLSIGLDIKTPSSSTKATDLIQPSSTMLGFLELRAAAEALEWLLSAAPQNAADEAYAEGWRLEWEAQVKSLEAQAYATVIQIQKFGAKIDWNTRVLKLLETSLPQARVREDPKNRLENLGTALNVEMKLRMLQVKTRDLMRQQQTLRAELGFLLGVSVEAIGWASVERLPVPLVPVSWSGAKREEFSNAVLGAISSSLRLRAGEKLARGASAGAKAEGRRGWFHLPQIRTSGLTAEQAGGESVPGWTPERRKANLEEADQKAALEVAQAQVELRARKGLDGIWMGLDQEKASEQMLAKYWADWQRNALTFHASNHLQMNLLGNMQDLVEQLIDARASSVSETLVGFVGLGILDPAELRAAPISYNLTSEVSAPRSEVRKWIQAVIKNFPLLLIAGVVLFLASCATGPSKSAPPAQAPKMEWKAPTTPRHMKIQKYKEPVLPQTVDGASSEADSALLPPREISKPKASIPPAAAAKETGSSAKQAAPEKVVKDQPSGVATDAEKASVKKNAQEKPAVVLKSIAPENAPVIETFLDTAKVLDAYHFEPGETRDALLKGEPIKKFQDALVAAAPILAAAGLPFSEDPLHTTIRGNYGNYTHAWLKKVMSLTPQIQEFLSRTPAETKTVQAPAPKPGETPSPEVKPDTEQVRSHAIDAAVANAQKDTRPAAPKNPATPGPTKAEKSSPPEVPAPAAKTAAEPKTTEKPAAPAAASDHNTPSPAAKAPATAAQDKTPQDQPLPKEEDLSGKPDSDFVFVTPEIKTQSAKLGEGPSGGFVISAFSSGEIRTSESGETQTWRIEDPIRANNIRQLFDLLKTDLGQLAGMDPQAWAPYELIMKKLKAAEEKIRLARALQDDLELGRLETGRFVETGHVFAKAGSVNTGDRVTEVFPDNVVGVETTVPLRYLVGTRLDLQINGKPAAILGPIQILKIDLQSGPSAVIHFSAQPAEGVEKDEDFSFRLRAARSGGVQEREPVWVELGGAGAWTTAKRAKTVLNAPESGFFKLEGPGYYPRNVHLASRRDGVQVLPHESWQDLLSGAQSLVDGAAEMLQLMNESRVGSEQFQAFQVQVHALSQVLTGIGQSIVKNPGNGLFTPDPQAAVLPVSQGAPLGAVYSDSVFFGSETVIDEMIMVRKDSNVRVGDSVLVVAASGEKLTGRVVKIVPEIPGERRSVFKDLQAVVVEVQSPASQIIVWPEVNLPVFDGVLRGLRESAPETSQLSLPGSGFRWVSGPAGLAEEGLLAAVGSKRTSPPSIEPLAGHRSPELVSTDSRPVVIQSDFSSEAVQSITSLINPGQQIEKLHGMKASLTDRELGDLLERGSTPLVFEVTRLLLTEKHDWAPALASLRSIQEHPGKDAAAAQRAGAIEGAMLSLLNQNPLDLPKDLRKLRGQSQAFPDAQRFIDSVFLYFLQKEGIHSLEGQAILLSGFFTDDAIRDVANLLQRSGDTEYQELGKEVRTFLIHKWAAEQIAKIRPDVVAGREMGGYDFRRPFENMSEEEVVANGWQNQARESDIRFLTTGIVTGNTSLGLESLVDEGTRLEISRRQGGEQEARTAFKAYHGNPRTSLGAWDVASGVEQKVIAEKWAAEGRYSELMRAFDGLDASQEELRGILFTKLTGTEAGRLQLYGDGAFAVLSRENPALVGTLIGEASEFADRSQPGMSGKQEASGLAGRYERVTYVKALRTLLGEESLADERPALMSALTGLVSHDYALRALVQRERGFSADTDLILDLTDRESSGAQRAPLREILRAAADRELARRATIMGVRAFQSTDGFFAEGEFHPGNRHNELETILDNQKLARVAKESLPKESSGAQVDGIIARAGLPDDVPEKVRARIQEALRFLSGQEGKRPTYDALRAAMPRTVYAWLPIRLAAISFVFGLFFAGLIFFRRMLLVRFVSQGDSFKASKALGSSSAEKESGSPVDRQTLRGKFASLFLSSFPDQTWFGEFRRQRDTGYYKGDYQELGNAMFRWARILEKPEPLTSEDWDRIKAIAIAIAQTGKAREKLSLNEEMLGRFSGNDRMHNRAMMQLMSELSAFTMDRMLREKVVVSRGKDYPFFRIFSYRLRALDKILFSLKNVKENLNDNRIVSQRTGNRVIDGLAVLIGVMEMMGWAIARFVLRLNKRAALWMDQAIDEIKEYEILTGNMQAFLPEEGMEKPREVSLTDHARKQLKNMQRLIESRSTPQDFSHDRRSRKIATRIALILAVAIALVLAPQVVSVGMVAGFLSQHFWTTFMYWVVGSYASIMGLSWHLASNLTGNNDFHGMEMDIKHKRMEAEYAKFAAEVLAPVVPETEPAVTTPVIPAKIKKTARVRVPALVPVTMEMIRRELDRGDHDGVDAIVVAVNQGDEAPARTAIATLLRETYHFISTPAVVVGVPGFESGNGLPMLTLMDDTTIEAELVANIPGWDKEKGKVLLLQAFGGKGDIMSLMTGSVLFTPTGETDEAGRQIPTGAVTAAWSSLLMKRLSNPKVRLFAPTDTFVLNALPEKLAGDITFFGATKRHEKAVGKYGVLIPSEDGARVSAILEKVPELSELQGIYYNNTQRALIPGERIAVFTGVVGEHIFDPEKRAGFQKMVSASRSAWAEALRENPKMEFDAVLDFWVPVLMASHGEEALGDLEKFVIKRARMTQTGSTLKARELLKREQLFRGLYGPLYEKARGLSLEIRMQVDKDAKFEDLRELPDLVKRLRRQNKSAGRGSWVAIPPSPQAERAPEAVVFGLNGTTPSSFPKVSGFYYAAVPLRSSVGREDSIAALHGLVPQFGGRNGEGIPVDRFKDETGRAFLGKLNLDEAPIFPTDLAREIAPGRMISDLLNDAYEGRDVVIPGGKGTLRAWGMRSLREIDEQRQRFPGLASPLYQHAAGPVPSRSEARGPVTLATKFPVKAEQIGNRDFLKAVISREGQSDAFEALLAKLERHFMFLSKKENVTPLIARRVITNIEAMRHEGTVRFFIDQETGNLTVADLDLFPRNETKRGFLFNSGVDTAIAKRVTPGSIMVDFKGFPDLTFQIEPGGFQIVIDDLKVAEASKFSPTRAKQPSLLTVSQAVAAATLIIFLGILPLGAGAYAATLAGKAFAEREALFQPDLRAMIAAATNKYPAMPAPQVSVNNILFVEGSLLLKLDEKMIESLKNLPFKVKVIFGKGEEKAYERFVRQLGGAEEGSLQSLSGKPEEIVRAFTLGSVRTEEDASRIAYVGSKDPVLRHLRAAGRVGTLVRVDAGDFIPGEWLVRAFNSFVFNLGKIRKGFIWSLDQALPFLLEQTLAAQHIAQAA